jgi:hypothetical protein
MSLGCTNIQGNVRVIILMLHPQNVWVQRVRQEHLNNKEVRVKLCKTCSYNLKCKELYCRKACTNQVTASASSRLLWTLIQLALSSPTVHLRKIKIPKRSTPLSDQGAVMKHLPQLAERNPVALQHTVWNLILQLLTDLTLQLSYWNTPLSEVANIKFTAPAGVNPR